jgi:hypothetical protein
MAMNPAEIGPENDCNGEDQQQTGLSSEGMPYINKPANEIKFDLGTPTGA